MSTFTSDPKGHTRFPSTEDIKGFGIRSTQVKLSDRDDYIELEPAYFRPFPEKNLLRRYPTQENQTVRSIPPSPAGFEKYFKKAVRHSKINTSNILEALYFWQGVAIRLYAEAQKDYQTHARAALRHVHSQLFANRILAGDVDIQSDANTFSLQDLNHWR